MSPSPFDLTEGSLAVALDHDALAMLKTLARKQGRKVQVLSATAMTLPALFAAADPGSISVIQIDAATPEDRFVRLLKLADVTVRGHGLDIVGGHA